MGMTTDEFDNIQLSRFFQKMIGFFDHQKQLQEAEWKRMAYVGYLMLVNNPYIKQTQKPKSFDAYLNKGKPATVKSAKQFEQLFL